jgi:hypothetical protein
MHLNKVPQERGCGIRGVCVCAGHFGKHRNWSSGESCCQSTDATGGQSDVRGGLRWFSAADFIVLLGEALTFSGSGDELFGKLIKNGVDKSVTLGAFLDG